MGRVPDVTIDDVLTEHYEYDLNGKRPQQVNLCLYTMGDPVNRIDPSGYGLSHPLIFGAPQEAQT